MRKVLAGSVVLAVVALAPVVHARASSPFTPRSGASAINTKALYHDTRNLSYRSPFGAVPMGTSVRLRFRTAHNGASSVTLETSFAQPVGSAKPRPALKLKRIATSKQFDTWQAQLTTSQTGVYGYDFLIKKGSAQVRYSDTAAAEGGVGQVYRGKPDQMFHITSFVPTFKPVSWANSMVVYQIFPDRFFDGDPSNDHNLFPSVYGQPPTVVTDPNTPPCAYPCSISQFYGGDLEGIIDKLPYLKTLGVNTLYLNPIFLSPSNHKYDTSNFLQIDPYFGTLATFKTLVQDLHADGMHLILDGVFNHTSSDSIYFNKFNRFPDLGAYQSKGSPYFPWYTFLSWPDGYQAFDGGAATQPTLTESDGVKDFIFRQPNSVAQYWLSQGSDGWRLDASTYKSHQFWSEFRTAVKARFPDDIMLCECDLSPIDALPYLFGNEDDGDMNYRFRDSVLRFFAHGAGSQAGLPSTATGFFNGLMGMLEEYPLPASQMSMDLVGSHDTSRVLTELQGNKSELRQVAAFQMTWVGAPTIYYGDEAGASDAPAGDTFYVSRNFFPWSNQDTDLEAYYSKVIHIRLANPALRDGTVSQLVLDNTHRIVAFLRKDAQQSVAVAINDDNKSHAIMLKLPGLKSGTILTDGISGKKFTVRNGMLKIALPATSTAILAQAPRA
jgi:glycosidase